MNDRMIWAAILPLAAGALAAAGQLEHQHDPAGSAMPAAMPMGSALPKESGQSALGVIGEIVDLLAADPATDWSKVNIGALRDHLVDMDRVALHAQVRSTPVPGGARFEVSGDGPVAQSIRRMTTSHAAMADDGPDRDIRVEQAPAGVAMTVTSETPAVAARIRASGFFGEMAFGTHHRRHHLMIAKGDMDH